MSLLTIKITPELTFDPGDSYAWMVDEESCDNNCILNVSETSCYDCSWCLFIDQQEKLITCEAWNPVASEYQYSKALPLRPGTVVLSDLHIVDPEDPFGEQIPPFTRASFRTPALQEFMDRYNIVAIRRLDPNRTFRRGEDLDDPYSWDTDGQVKELVNCDHTITGWTISDASWAIARVWLMDENRFARVLYAKQRVSVGMEKSFLLHGINPKEP